MALVVEGRVKRGWGWGFVLVESIWSLAMASSTCARRCASAGVKLARAASAAPVTAGRTAGGEGFGFVVNRPQVVVGGGGGGRIGGMVMAMECWRSPMMVQAQLMSCCAKVDNPPPREVSFFLIFNFFAMCRSSNFFCLRFFACEVVENVCKSYTSQAFVKLSVRCYMRTGSPLLKD